ncbi:hypothetical protein [Cellulomonas sp. URHB0016]
MLTVDDVAPGPGLAVAVADVPDEQRRTPVRWDPADGHLLVLGGPGSGRTTTLVTVGVEALRAGLAVHAVGLPPGAVELIRAHDLHGRVGTVARSDEVVRVARLAELLGSRPAADRPAGPGPRAVLLVDGLPAVLDALGTLARGAGSDRLAGLWRAGGPAVAVVASSDVTGSAVRHGAQFRDRLVLRVADPSLDAVAGVPAAVGGPRPVPGRAVHLGPEQALLCQVALPGPAPTSAGAARGQVAAALFPPVRVEPLPRYTARPLGAHGTAGRVPIGVGGDGAAVVELDVRPGLLVVGPPGSGRSTVLRLVAEALAADGEPVLRLVDLAGGPVPALRGVVDLDLAGGAADLTALDRSGRWTVLVDDLDEKERTHPELVDAWARWSGPGRRFVAATTSSAATGAFRGLTPSLLRQRRAVVLDLHDAASAELVGGRAAWLADPADRPAGRGVVVVGRTVTPVQLYAFDREGSTVGPGPPS